MTAPLGPTDLKRLHRTWRRRTSQRLALVLDDVSTTFNIGTIVRSAAAYGVDHVYLTEGTTALDNPKAGRASKGTERYLRWSTHPDGPSAVAAARADGFAVWAVELVGDGRPAFEVDLSGDVALVVGHEDRGVAKATLAVIDGAVFLPQVGKVGSLNVGVAASMALYEARRQSWTAGSASTSDD